MAHVPNAINRYLFHPLQAAGAFIAFVSFRLLPLDWASGVGGAIARFIGPRLRLSDRARKNLKRAFPEKTPFEIEAIVIAMWEHLGRVVGEYPHLGKINVYDPEGPVKTIGGEHVDTLRDDGRPGIFYSGHIGNWELVSLGATQRDLPLDRIYREANNRLVEWLYRQGRTSVEGALIKKGPEGVRELLNIFKQGRHLGMLVDQKLNDGIPVPFFGRDAMTAPALAEMALRYDCPVVAARVKRLNRARFVLEILPPVQFEKTGDKAKDVADAMTQVNAQLEAFIRDAPEQWLWLHNRWPAE